MIKQRSSHQIDMLSGSLMKSIILFALPLAASSILQQLFNAVDVAVVGHFATMQDQAAVGCNSSLINLLVNLFTGLSIGTNVMVSNYLGQKDERRISATVHTSILVAAVSGMALLALGQFIARPVLVLMNTPPDTLELAVSYFKIYFLGMPFIMVYNFGAAILRSIGDTLRPLYCLIATGILNAVLNLIFVISFGMGVAGVAIATVIANALSAGVVLYLLFHEAQPIGLRWRKLKIERHTLGTILRIGVPAGVQGAVFSLTNVFIQSALNNLGSDVDAGSAVALNYEYITYFIINAFAQAAVSFVSQNYGAGNTDRCKKVFWVCMLYSCVLTGTLSGIISANSNFFASLFSDKAPVIAYAETRIKIILTINFIASSYEIAGAALRGIGHSMTPAVLTIFGTCALRLVWIYTVFRTLGSLESLLYVYPVSWVVTGIAVLAAYFIATKKAYGGQITRSC